MRPSNITISHCNFMENGHQFLGSGAGILIQSFSNITIVHNNFTENSCAISLYSPHTVVIANSNIIANDMGITVTFGYPTNAYFLSNVTVIYCDIYSNKEHGLIVVDLSGRNTNVTAKNIIGGEA